MKEEIEKLTEHLHPSEKEKLYQELADLYKNKRYVIEHGRYTASLIQDDFRREAYKLSRESHLLAHEFDRALAATLKVKYNELFEYLSRVLKLASSMGDFYLHEYSGEEVASEE
ncbi:MAG: hypothetical protein KDH96_02265 [Candidatus Riesia sp.]|nr:hypothetical protein [Candidatus Riesia sp.]